MALELSPINALSYQILRSNYEVINLDRPGTASDDLNFNFNTSDLMRQDDGTEKLEAVLDIHVMPNEENPSGYRIDIAVRGMFVAKYSEDGGTKEDFEMFMKVNSYTLLYAFIRSHVQMITSMSPSGQICLPCLDVGSIVDVLSVPPAEPEEAAEQSN